MPRSWDSHVVHEAPGEPAILYIDLHLVHEVTSAQAFEGLRVTGRRVRRPDLTVATLDHNVPTADRHLPITDPISAQQVETLRENCREFGIPLYDLDDRQQGIVHIIGPELGLTQPGITIVCGDSQYLHARRVRQPGVRDWHLRAGARLSDAVPPTDPAADPRSAYRG